MRKPRLYERSAMPEFCTMQVAVLVRGNRAALYDKHGIRICRGIETERLGEVSQIGAQRAMWAYCVKLLCDKFRDTDTHQATEWEKRIAAMLRSWCARFQSRDPGAREDYKGHATVIWPDAIGRMIKRGTSAATMRSRTKWEIWSHNVATNHRKRIAHKCQRAQATV